jgi:hypothetical protein
MRSTISASLLAGCLVACGSNTTPPPPARDLAMSSNLPDLSMTTQPDDLTMMSSDDSGGGPGVDMVQCDSPTKLFPPKKPGDLYCPFGKTDAGSLYCTGGTTHCCEPAQGMSACVAEATPCAMGDTDWVCEDPADCPAQMVCCGSGTLVQTGNPMCGNYATGFHGTHCAASCMPNEIQMCTSNGECSNGKNCIPFGTKGNQVGGCG